MEIIRVVLADDHPLVRAGIRTTLLAEHDLSLIGEAADGMEVRRLCDEQRPDVLLLDLNMPELSPVEMVSYLHDTQSALKILVLTAYNNEAYVRSLVAAGISGYVLKDEAPETVVRAIRAVMQGDVWFSQVVVRKLAEWQAGSHGEEAGRIDLTKREQQILQLMAQAYDNGTIANELNLAEQSVCNYISRIYSKLQVNSRAAAIVSARKWGLVTD